jgi:peroxiredoxin
LIIKKLNFVSNSKHHADEWQIPDRKALKVTCQFGLFRVKSEELYNPRATGFTWPVLVLFPFLDGSVCDAKIQQFGQLRHGKVQVYALLSQVLP